MGNYIIGPKNLYTSIHFNFNRLWPAIFIHHGNAILTSAILLDGIQDSPSNSIGLISR